MSLMTVPLSPVNGFRWVSVCLRIFETLFCEILQHLARTNIRAGAYQCATWLALSHFHFLDQLLVPSGLRTQPIVLLPEYSCVFRVLLQLDRETLNVCTQTISVRLDSLDC